MADCGAGLDRRTFLKLVGCGGCAAVVGAATGCTIAEVFDQGAGELAFDVAEQKFAALASIDGVVAVDVAGRPVLLIRTAEDAIVALNRICTHTQCDMAPGASGRWDGDKLICTCHDSHFGPDGKVLAGPAPRDLTTYPVAFDPNTGQGTLTVGGTPEPEDPVPAEFRDLINPFDPEDAETLAAGEELWMQCSSCHGLNGEGNDAFPAPSPTVFAGADNASTTDGYLFWRIRTGPEGGPMGSIMPTYSEQTLSDDQVWQVVTYLRSFGQ